MSQENVQTLRGVRYRVSLPPERSAERRTLDERFFVRFPDLYRLVATAVTRLPVRSRLRRALIARTVARGMAAANRRDFDLLVLGLDPGLEYRPRSDWGDVLDLDAVFHGHAGLPGGVALANRRVRRFPA